MTWTPHYDTAMHGVHPDRFKLVYGWEWARDEVHREIGKKPVIRLDLSTLKTSPSTKVVIGNDPKMIRQLAESLSKAADFLDTNPIDPDLEVPRT